MSIFHHLFMHHSSKQPLWGDMFCGVQSRVDGRVRRATSHTAGEWGRWVGWEEKAKQFWHMHQIKSKPQGWWDVCLSIFANTWWCHLRSQRNFFHFRVWKLYIFGNHPHTRSIVKYSQHVWSDTFFWWSSVNFLSFDLLIQRGSK